MPPKGKQQLTREEIDFIDWWVANMTTYDEELNALNPTGEVMDLVQEIFVKEEYDVSPADPLLVESLRSRGVKLSSMGTDVPWLAASLRNSGNLKASFKDLLKVKDQIYELDLAGAGITSKEIKYVNSFENLQSLSLANAAITTEDFTKVKPRESMRSINVVGTKIDQTAYEHFKKFTSLEKIFVWNSSIEQEIVDKWKKEMPQWRIVSGADLSIFKSVKLEAPIIAVEKDIFTDSILVSLITQAPKSQVFYTLDGSPPDSSSFEYQAPFYVFKSSQVKAIVRKSDWEDSAPSAQTIMRAKYEAKNVVLKEPPAERYQGKGPKSLIDLEKGSEDFTDGQWLGFQGKHIEAIVTLDSLVELNSVTLSFQQDYVSYIYYPSGITVRTSPDGEIYGNPVNYDIPLLEAPEGKRLENFLVRLPKVEAQYVKIFLTSRLKNPDWHPAPGAPSWVFIDEILVE